MPFLINAGQCIVACPNGAARSINPRVLRGRVPGSSFARNDRHSRLLRAKGLLIDYFIRRTGTNYTVRSRRVVVAREESCSPIPPDKIAAILNRRGLTVTASVRPNFNDVLHRIRSRARPFYYAEVLARGDKLPRFSRGI